MLGGNRGVICFFDLDKNLSHINTLGFQMKNINEEYFLNNIYISNNDSIITIITQNQLKQQYWVMNTHELDGDVSAIQPLFPNG